LSGRLVSRREALARFASFLAASPLLRAQAPPRLIGEPPGRIAPADELVNTFEFEAMAERKLDDATFAAIAGSEREGLDRITFRPRLMVNTLKLDLTAELFGEPIFAPIVAGPISRQQRFHPEGELATVRGASATKTPMVVADRSDAPVERIAAKAEIPLWYQVYPEPDLAGLVGRIKKAVAAGCKAVVVTVGTPYQPAGAKGYPRLDHLTPMGDPALGWPYLDQIREKCAIPVLLKGILDPGEARTAVERGFDGVIVSNHGGRFLDGLADPITMLPEIAEAVGGRIPILIDGGFRRGGDVLKALALGARAVLLGRPIAWGLAAYGAEGVQAVLGLMQNELARDMAMFGAVNLEDIRREFVTIHDR